MHIVGQRLRYHPSGYSGTQYAGGAAVNGVAASWFSQVLPIATTASTTRWPAATRIGPPAWAAPTASTR